MHLSVIIISHFTMDLLTAVFSSQVDKDLKSIFERVCGASLWDYIVVVVKVSLTQSL